MKTFYSVIVILWLKHEICRVSSSTESCCSHRDELDRADYVEDLTEGYERYETDESNVEPKTSQSTLPQEYVTIEISTPSPSPKNNGCSGDNRVTSVYERAHDVDMRYVQESITSMWRIIFSLVFILILLVFLISYVYSLMKKNNSRQDHPVNRNQKIPTFAETFVEKNAHQLYFPVINASRTANFLKDLDPIYDYPCSVQSDYERV